VALSGEALRYLISEILAHTFGIISLEQGTRAIPARFFECFSHRFDRCFIGIYSDF
jgi:hypothetical protein